MRRLLVNDRRVLAPTSRSFRSNLYRVVRGRFQALERRRQFRGLDDGGVGRVVVTRITPHWKVSYRSREGSGIRVRFLPSYLSTRSLSPPSVIGASQLMLNSELFTLVILTLLTKLGTLASVVTVMSTYSDLPANAETPFSANTWNR